MPLTDHQKAVALAVGLPGIAGVVGTAAYLTDKTGFDWYKSLKRPDWAVPGDKTMIFHSIFDTATVIPAAYATVKVCEKGGFDSCDAKKALASYGTGMAIGMFVGFAIKKKCMKCLSVGMTGLFANSLVCYHLYANVDQKSAYYVLPSVAYFGYLALMLYRMWCMNEEEKKDQA